MLKKFLDIKNILILSLTILVVWLIIFRPSKEVANSAKYRIEQLENRNQNLLERNQKLNTEIGFLNDRLIEIITLTSEKERQLGKIDYKLNKLLKRKDEIRGNVDTLDNVGITNAFTDYIQRRSKINN